MSEGLASEQDDSRATELMFAVLLTAEKKKIFSEAYYFYWRVRKIAESDN